MNNSNPFQFGLYQRMRRFFTGEGDIRDCIPDEKYNDDIPGFEFSPAPGAGSFEDMIKSGMVHATPAHVFLLRAAGHMENRAITYDAAGGERSIGRTVEMFNTLYGKDLTEEQGWMFMAILKMVRSAQGPVKEDSYEDLAAYAGLAGESATRQRRG